jgi:hypothetical protein
MHCTNDLPPSHTMDEIVLARIDTNKNLAVVESV